MILALTSKISNITGRALAWTLVLFVFLATFKISAKEDPYLNICSIANSYSFFALKQKNESGKLTVEEAYSSMVYALRNTKAFSNLNQSNQSSFLGFISDIYEFVFFNDVNETNIEELALKHCKSRVADSWSVINEKAIECQSKGRFSENMAKNRAKGLSLAFLKEFYVNKESNEVIKSERLRVLNLVYADKIMFEPTIYGQVTYKQCMHDIGSYVK
jgi:hypothetical protein